MAGLRKDVELIFRGEDRASPTIKGIRENVSKLASAIDEQTRAASKGEGSVDDLAKAFNRLKGAQGDVGEIVKLATAYESLTNKLGDQSKKTEEARAKSAALTAQLAAAEKPSKRLQSQYEANERKLASSIATEERFKNELIQLGAAMDAAGLDSKDFARTQEIIRQSAIETARALRDAAAAFDAFKGKQATGKANVAAQSEAEQFNKLAAGSGLPQAQIAFISTLENRLQALQTAIREDQASMSGLNAELRSNAANDAAQRVRSMAASLDEADAAALRLKATADFRAMATQIEAGARNISRFGSQFDTNAVSAQRFADTIQGILNPASAAGASLDSITTALGRIETVTQGAKARLADFNAEANNISSVSAGISNISRLTDEFARQKTVTAAAEAEMNRAQAEVLQLAGAMKSAEVPTQEMANALQAAEAKLQTAGTAFQRESTTLAGLDAKLVKVGVDTKNLAGAQNTLTAAAQRLAAAEAKVNAKTSGTGAFMGLRPHELQNLGYQVNDIIVSIASGQAPMRVFLQQGAQIGQIIPGAFSRIIALAPQLAVIAAIFVTVGSAIKKAGDEAERLKTATGIVAQMGDGTNVTTAQFNDLALSMEKAGVKADDVRSSLVQLAADGLDASQMEQYIETAKALSEVTGVEMKDALETVRGSFQGGMEDIIALDDAQNVYSDTQLQTIQNLFDEGKADEARTMALGIFQDKMETVAGQSRGPWTTAANQLSAAWSNFIGWLSHTEIIDNFMNGLRRLGVMAAWAAALVNQAVSGKGLDPAAALKLAKGVGGGPALPGRAGTKGVADPNRTTNAGRRTAQLDAEELKIAQARTPAELRAAKAIKVRREAAEEAAQAHLSSSEAIRHIDSEMAAFNAKEDTAQGKRDAAAGKRAAAAGRRAEAHARAEARRAAAAAKRAAAEHQRLLDEGEGLGKKIEQLDAAAHEKGDLEDKLDAIDEKYKQLFRDIEEFRAKTAGKGLIGGETIDNAIKHAEATKELLKDYAKLADFTKRIKDLEDERANRLEQIDDRRARGQISPEQALIDGQGVITDIATKVAGVAQDGLTFAATMAGVIPNDKLVKFIGEMNTAASNTAGGTDQKLADETTMKAVTDAQDKLNAIIESRNALVEHENQLVTAGLETYSAAQDKIASFYEKTNGLIGDQAAEVLRLAAAFKDSADPAMRRFYEALVANLGNVTLEAQGVNTSFTTLKGHITEILSTQIVGFIDSMAQAFAHLAERGGKDVLGFLEELGRAFLTMVANILQTVATLIIEAFVLDAVDKATGGILKPLLMLTSQAVQFRHAGGIAGGGADGGGFNRKVNPMVFANAPRYHSGGIAGLAPNETAAVLKKGEEVLTESNPRHRNNYDGGAAATGMAARAVLAVGDEEIAKAMNGPSGEKVVLFHLRRNRASVKQMLDS